MSRAGIAHPSLVDLVTLSDTTCTLILVEEHSLSEDDALALQEKLNNYLSYAVDGALVKRYPQANGKSVSIRVDLYAKPRPFIVEFLRRYREAIASSGVGLACTVNDNELSLEVATRGA